MKHVALPDDIADALESVPPAQRGDFLRQHGFVLPVSESQENGSSAETIVLYTDGASRSNPGEAGAGFVLKKKDDTVLFEGKKYLGVTTNNVAEWKALYLGLRQALEMGVKNVRCLLDSELVVRQMNGEYKVKHPDLKPFYEKVHILKSQFENFCCMHIPREKNAHADRLSNEAIDEKV